MERSDTDTVIIVLYAAVMVSGLTDILPQSVVCHTCDDSRGYLECIPHNSIHVTLYPLKSYGQY